MLSPSEEEAVAAQFGVARSQVRRDHLISHLLAALEPLADRLLFFGGTALSRTFAPHGRLSEDIDLIALGRRTEIAEAVEAHVRRGLRREFPGLRWDPSLRSVRTHPAAVVSPDGLTVRVQLLRDEGYSPWPTERRPLVQRYSDAPPVVLSVPTRASFAAWKTVTWTNHNASRDLYDLWSLSHMNAITAEASGLFVRFGPTGKPPSAQIFGDPPPEHRWRRDLDGQTRLTLSAAQALDVVRDAWARVANT